MAIQTLATLTQQDRCDVRLCGARAWYRVVIPQTLDDLLFCAHHFREHESQITEQALIVYDESGPLYADRQWADGWQETYYRGKPILDS